MEDKDIYYVYSDHLGGGYYYTDHEQEYDDLYCETCGDSDYYITSGTKAEILQEYEQGICEAREKLKQIKEIFNIE